MSNIGSFILSGVLSILLPVKLYLIVITIIIFLDMFYGIRSLKKKSKSFKWSIFLDGFIKKTAIYTPAIVGIYYLEAFILKEIMEYFINIPFIITKVMTMGILSRELISINSNYETISGQSITSGVKSIFKIVKDSKKEIDNIDKDEETKKDK